MTDEMMTLRTLLEKSSDTDLLREMIGFTAQRLMDEPSGSAGLEIGAWRDRTSVEFDKNATVRKAINSAVFPLL